MKKIEIIAEVACIHEGEKEYIYSLVSDFKTAGATAIKFQCFDPDEVVGKTHPDYEYLKKISLSISEWSEIILHCTSENLNVYLDYSGNFSLKIIKKMDKAIKGVKINSSEMQNKFVLDNLTNLNLELLISCSGSNLLEIIDVLELFEKNENITLMHGFQSFPKDFEAKGGPPVKLLSHDQQNLNKIHELKKIFPQFRIGICDHLEGGVDHAIDVPSFAIAAGASVIEKHVTIDRLEKREDYSSALEPNEFKSMVEKIYYVQKVMGSEVVKIDFSEKNYIQEMKKNVISKKNIFKSESINQENIILERDGKFKNSLNIFRVLENKVNKDIQVDNSLSNLDLSKKIGIFCNARLSSNRLPKKALLPFFKNMSTLGYLINRLKSYDGNIGHLALATTILPEDDQLVEIAKINNTDFFRGSSEDVMGRMVGCAEYYKWDTIVRVTGDDQFVSCEHIEEAIKYHLQNNYEFTRVNGLPLGMSCEIIEYKTIKIIHNYIQDKSQTEHLTWFLDNDWICKNGLLEVNLDKKFQNYRLTLDYKEDYELMKKIAASCHKKYGDQYLKTNDILKELELIRPKWKHDDNLWTIKRNEVNTSLRYLKK